MTVAERPGVILVSEKGLTSSAALAVGLHGLLVAMVLFGPQLVRPHYFELPTLGPTVLVSIEGVGGPPAGSGSGTRAATATLPDRPAPPAPAPAPPITRSAPAPRPSDDLTLPGKGRPRPAAPLRPVDDLRPVLGPITRQPLQSTPIPTMTARAPSPVVAGAGAGSGTGAVDIHRKAHGIASGTGTGVDELTYYFARVQDKISAFWTPLQQGGPEIRTMVGIHVQANGQVRGITVEETSGDRTFDEAALRALRQALPLPPFPLLVKEPSMDLILKFTNKGLGG